MCTHELIAKVSRALFLSHRAQTGLCLTQERLAALQSGNTSVIHPALLYAAQLWGCAVNKADTSYFRVLTETVQLQNALDCLNDSRSSIDPTTAIEVGLLLNRRKRPCTHNKPGSPNHLHVLLCDREAI